MKKKSILMGAAMAGLLFSGTACGDKPGGDMSQMNKDEMMAGGQCYGVNSCKGKGACAQQEHDCAGKNSCKGKGWVKKSKAECEAEGGTYKEV